MIRSNKNGYDAVEADSDPKTPSTPAQPSTFLGFQFKWPFSKAASTENSPPTEKTGLTTSKGTRKYT